MKAVTVLVTGSDTGVGKTVLTALLARRLAALHIPAPALKPFCSGGRDDARALQSASGDLWSLDEINPWHFRAPLSPLLAARRQGVRVSVDEVLRFVRGFQRRYPVVLVEGAGGLLSPLGEGFSARELIVGLVARPVVVVPNRLGAVNQALLVLAALPPRFARCAPVVLVDSSRPDSSADTNPGLLAESLGHDRLHRLPWLEDGADTSPGGRLGSRLDALLRACGVGLPEVA
ncbi:MAG: dethiobiotin synthase [Limisphaerales bacterium]